MAVIQVILIFSYILLVSNAFYLPPNDGSDIGEHFLNQKLNFLEGKFKNSPQIDFDLIKQKIEAKRLAEKEAESNPEDQDQKLWFFQNKFTPKFNFIQERIESKKNEEDSNLDVFNEKVAFLESLLNQHFNNHGISKREIKEESNPAIGNYFLNQKLSFLENKFKNSPLVDFDLIKQKIEAKQAAKEQEEKQEIAQKENNITNLLNFLKQLYTQKLETHQVAKRSVEETKDPSIGKYFLNQKLSFLENKFKNSPSVNFDLIKQKIEAKKAAKEQEELNETHQIAKRSAEEIKDPSIGKYFLNQKLSFLENKFKNSPLVNFDLIKQKIEAKKAAKEQEQLNESHHIAKRSAEEIKDPSIGKYFLNQKLSFLENKFKNSPLLNFDLIKQKIEAKKAAKEQEELKESHQIAKRSAEEIKDPSIGKYFLNQKLSFLENKFKNSPLVNFDLIKQKIEAKKAAKQQEQLNESHQIAKRSVEETNIKDPSIGNYFLNQKLSFMENKFKGTPIDFEAIKNKIETKKEAKLQEELLQNENDLNESKKLIQEKFAFLQNFLEQLKADQLKAIIDKIEGKHNVAKRAVKNDDSSKKDFYLNQKYAFLSNKFKQMNMDSEGLLQKIQSKQKGGQ